MHEATKTHQPTTIKKGGSAYKTVIFSQVTQFPILRTYNEIARSWPAGRIGTIPGKAQPLIMSQSRFDSCRLESWNRNHVKK